MIGKIVRALQFAPIVIQYKESKIGSLEPACQAEKWQLFCLLCQFHGLLPETGDIQHTRLEIISTTAL